MRVLWSNGHKRITLIQGAFATLEWRSYILMRGDFFVCKISGVESKAIVFSDIAILCAETCQSLLILTISKSMRKKKDE